MNEVEIIVAVSEPPREVVGLKPFALDVLDKLGVDDWIVGVLITDDDGIRHYNRRWRGIGLATDVLSFVQSEGESFPLPPGTPFDAGDVVVSAQRVAEQAESLNEAFEKELRRVVIHGILHLRGMDHPGDDTTVGC